MYRAIVVLFFAAIVIALFSSLYSLMKSPAGNPSTVNRLMWRVIFSIALLVILIVGFTTGQLSSNVPW